MKRKFLDFGDAVKRIALFLMLIFCSADHLLAQRAMPENPFKFVMNEPAGWFPISKAEIEESLKRFDLRNDSLQNFLAQNQGKYLLFAYVKFRQDSFTGLNPKIEGRVIQINSQKPLTFSEFKPAAETTLRKIASQFDEQRYLVEPSVIKIAGIDSVYHVSEFQMSVQNGSKLRVRSRTYLIPRGTYFFQISFVDEPDRGDCSAEFDELIKSIKLLK